MPLAVVAEVCSRSRIVGAIGLGASCGIAAFRRDRDRGAVIIIIAVVVVAGIVVARSAVIGVAAADRGTDGHTGPESAAAAIGTAVTAGPSVAALPISALPISVAA